MWKLNNMMVPFLHFGCVSINFKYKFSMLWRKKMLPCLMHRFLVSLARDGGKIQSRSFAEQIFANGHNRWINLDVHLHKVCTKSKIDSVVIIRFHNHRSAIDPATLQTDLQFELYIILFFTKLASWVGLEGTERGKALSSIKGILFA